MPTRIIAIGDVHGCATALRTLLKVIQPRTEDVLIPLGDCIDRGPASRQVIEELLALRDACQLVPLLGNHEEMMLAYLDGRPLPDDWLECGGAATVESYRERDGKLRPPPPEHIDFVRSWGDCFETDTHFFVHASYESERPLAQQHWRTMRWQTLRGSLPEPHCSGKTAIVGHTSQKSGEILNVGHLMCIDTYCWGGHWLTAFDASSGQVWQANDRGQLRSSGAG